MTKAISAKEANPSLIIALYAELRDIMAHHAHHTRETWIGKCQCGRAISTSRRLCREHADLQPIRHAGIETKHGTILFTAGGVTEPFGRVSIDYAELIQRCNKYVGSPFVRLKTPPDLILVDYSPVALDFIEMVYNDAAVVNYIGGDGSYEGAANERELHTLTVARRLYAAQEPARNDQSEPPKPNS